MFPQECSSNGSLLKPRHSASGSFTRENVKDFEVGVHVPMCSRALLKLGDNRLLLNCSNVVRYSTIRTDGQDSAPK